MCIRDSYRWQHAYYCPPITFVTELVFGSRYPHYSSLGSFTCWAGQTCILYLLNTTFIKEDTEVKKPFRDAIQCHHVQKQHPSGSNHRVHVSCVLLVARAEMTHFRGIYWHPGQPDNCIYRSQTNITYAGLSLSKEHYIHKSSAHNNQLDCMQELITSI